MDKVLEIVKWLIEYGPQIIAALIGALTAAAGVALLIPGPQPEKAFYDAAAFLSKFSAKPKE